MIHTHAEQRPLIDWLIMQEKVLRLWIEEAVANGSGNPEFVSRLEAHHAWLAEQIDYFAARRAA